MLAVVTMTLPMQYKAPSRTTGPSWSRSDSRSTGCTASSPASNAGDPSSNPAARIRRPRAAGGILYDLGSHLVDQALHLFGPTRSVYAEIAARRPGAQVDDDVFLALTHTSGVRSHLWSALAGQVGPRLRALGDRSAYTVYGLDPQEAALRQGQRPGPDWGAPARTQWGLLGTVDDAEPHPPLPGDYPAFYAGVAAALREGRLAPVDPYDAVATLIVLEAARDTATQGRTVELPQVAR
ncbi:putative dehydrogenase [Kitasatospora sp. GAS1066B]